MKDPTKIRRAEVVKVNRQTLLSLVNSLEIAAGEIEKNGNAPMWYGVAPSETIYNIARGLKDEALKE